ncbi:nocturnin isoform X1 [Drosophila hydei]|uniref:Nocturnin n=1 Tax=Drosophila hydei TaxID=7224 RepID=A0A6J1LXH3_DROHY|nr:nocturnin isoform X1 [Drosophila hydei]
MSLTSALRSIFGKTHNPNKIHPIPNHRHHQLQPHFAIESANHMEQALQLNRANKAPCKNDRKAFLQRVMLTSRFKGSMPKFNVSQRHSHSLFIFSIILRKILYRKPKELMGSFNSAPKINNVDSQDDGLELPKGLSTAALLDHVQQLHGAGTEKPSLLSRCFLKPSPNSADVTDGLRCLKLNSVSRVCSAPADGAQNIRLLQWNILSQTLGQHNDGFVRCPDEALTWQHRKYLIVQEILQNQPDVVCLQEVDHFKFLQTVLGSQNYAGIFFPKPDSPCLYIEQNNGPDGCAIFYKRDKLHLVGYDTRILEVWRVQSNQVAIAARLQLKASGKEFCVCTTHLKARHGALLAKLRNEQGRDLIRFVKQFAGESPLLLCGDFNAEPVEPIYATILGCDLFKLGSAYADMKLEREREWKREQQQPLSHTDSSEDPNELIAQSIKREPPYTTWKIREDGEECHTIDYVFYTPQQLKIKNCLEFPAGEQIGKNRTPSFEYPSDHFSLVCDFELVDEPLSEGNNKSHGSIQ